MKLITNGIIPYEIENISRLFFPEEKFEREETVPKYGDYIFTNTVDCENEIILIAGVYVNSLKRESTEKIDIRTEKSVIEKRLTILLFDILCDICGFTPKWGILTGVRPTKLLISLCEKYGSDEAACNYFKNFLRVSEKKINLALDTVPSEKAAADYSGNNSYSLYVSIPFCPTRCSYCSFVSHSVEKTEKLVAPYVDLLCEELKQTAKIAESLGLSLKTIYFGGGTPTQLSAQQLDAVMRTIKENFNLGDLLEYTVEAGRPDTITYEKLEVLKNYNVSRISINPQTMNNSVLEAIGRRHTAEQTLNAYKLAKSCGFNNINMDIIAGLPTDDFKGFCKTLNSVLSLSPSNITVHTLSVKRSSTMAYENTAQYAANSEMVEEMLDEAAKCLYERGYKPYYLYRQSKMLGNMENVGWSKESFDCLYNIYMMNELHTVLAVGAGAVSRLKAPQCEHIERIYNYKYPYEYIERFETMILRKNKVREFYERYPI